MQLVRNLFRWMKFWLGAGLDLGKRKSGTSEKIRDFIYLDTERVRSYLAQMEDGHQAERGETRSHDVGASLQGEAGVFGVKANGGGSYQYGYASSVNYRAHDEAFARLLERLKKRDRIIEVSNEIIGETQWLKDGQFVLMQSVVKVIDFDSLRQQLASAPNIIALSEGKPSSNASQRTNTATYRKQLKQFDGFAEFVYGKQLVMVRSFFATQPHDISFRSHVTKENFRYAPTWLQSQYGSLIDAGWYCVLVVNNGDRENMQGLLRTQATEGSFHKTVEYINDIFVNALHNLDADEDELSAVLLAVYREIDVG
jgi:hypothetical protein